MLLPKKREGEKGLKLANVRHIRRTKTTLQNVELAKLNPEINKWSSVSSWPQNAV